MRTTAVSYTHLDVYKRQVQAIVGELIALGEEMNLNIDKGEHYWDMMIDWYLHNDAVIKAIDAQKCPGTSAFVGRALACYFGKRCV